MRVARVLLLALLCISPAAAQTTAGGTSSSGGEELPVYSHKVTLHPLAGLPALVSFVPADPGILSQVRALLVLDGELLVIPLKGTEASAFRGTFPTPKSTLNYRFQVVLRSGKSVLSPSYSVETQCHDKVYKPEAVSSDRMKRALMLQLREQRLKYIVEVLDKIPGIQR